jgi:hypothetical protein
LSRLEKEKGELTNQLEDERRKVEDLQFRFEEEAIIKCDIQVRIYSILYELLNILLHFGISVSKYYNLHCKLLK